MDTASFPALTNALRMLGLPIDVGANLLAKGGDEFSNLVSRAAGRTRNPTEQEQKTIPGMDAAFAAWENALRSMRDTGASGANAAMNALGWTPGGPTTQPQQEGALPPAAPQPTRSAPPANPHAQPHTARPIGPNTGTLPPQPAGPARMSPIARGALPPEPAAMPMSASAEATADPDAMTREQPQQPPRQSAADRYRERMAQMSSQQPNNRMTQEQKGRALVEAGLAIMASASKPGAKALGAIGEGGLRGTALAREFENTNRAEARDTRREAREDVRHEFDIGRHEEEQSIRREDMGERRRDREEGRKQESRRIDLLERQLEQGKWQVLDNGKTGTYVLFDKASGQTKDTGIKVPSKGTDNTPAEVRLIEYLRKNPDAMETMLKMKGKESDRLSSKDVLNAAVRMAGGEMGLGNNPDVDAILRRNVEAVRRATGQGAPQPAPTPPKPATEADAHKQARDAARRGIPLESINQRLQQWGYRPI